MRFYTVVVSGFAFHHESEVVVPESAQVNGSYPPQPAFFRGKTARTKPNPSYRISLHGYAWYPFLRGWQQTLATLHPIPPILRREEANNAHTSVSSWAISGIDQLAPPLRFYPVALQNVMRKRLRTAPRGTA